jgi:hypothetical protein
MSAAVFGIIQWADGADMGALVTLILGAGVGGVVYLAAGMVLNPTALGNLRALLPTRKST